MKERIIVKGRIEEERVRNCKEKETLGRIKKEIG